MLGSLVAIVAGHMARSEIRRSGGTLDGDGMALVGLALGWAPVVLGLLGLMVVFLFLGGVAWLASVG